MSHTIAVDRAREDGHTLYKMSCTCGWERIALTLHEVELAEAWHMNDSKSSVELFETHLHEIEAGAWVYVAFRHRSEFIEFMREHGHPTLLALGVNKSILRFHL